MATDKLHIKVDYYIVDEPTDNSNANGFSSLMAALTQLAASVGAPAILKTSLIPITTNLSNSYPFTNLLQTQNGSSGTSLPKPYLNILFFDEQFQFIQQNSELIQVTTGAVRSIFTG